eukprot:gene8352-8173_t
MSTQTKPLAADSLQQHFLSGHISASGRLQALHDRLLQALPHIDRIACALYDSSDDTLTTFINSTRSGQPLPAYHFLLADSPSLSALARDASVRMLDDLSHTLQPINVHTRWLLDQGYQSSFTVPMYDQRGLLGFIFFDSLQLHAFPERTQRDLLLYSNLISMTISNEQSMRTNLPVTQNEHLIDDGRTIVSTTDLRGNITFANPYFVEVSGYTESELLGAPQNILRHPDMPAEAFADMWRCIQSGMPWTGMVKNRCKNGDYYWVLANVTPVIERGQTTGYMSVRTKPSREQVRAADQLYQEFKAGNPRRMAIVNGRAIETHLRARIKEACKLGIHSTTRLNALILTALMLLFAAVFYANDASPWMTGAALLGAAIALNFWRTLYVSVVAANDRPRLRLRLA